MKKIYKSEVLAGLSRMNSNKSLIIESDLEHLPPIIKKYLGYTGTVGREKIHNVRIKSDGRIRSKVDGGWMKFISEQYNFFDSPTRLFYIKAYKMGIPATGIHIYKEEKAIMKIKLAGLFTIVDAKGPEMNQGETVTVFNDMCCMAPATLIDKSIQWETVDPLTIKARYTNGDITISATLFFNNEGALINFISNDRFETTDGKIYKNYPWSTPIKGFADFGGITAPAFASAIYSKQDSDFCYGEFNLKEIEYNCMEYKNPSRNI